MLRVSWFLAVRNLRYRKWQTLLLVFVIAIAFVSMIFTASVIKGMKHRVEKNIVDFSLGHVIIEPKEGKKVIENSAKIVKEVEKLPYVLYVTFHITKGVTVFDKNGKSLSTELYIVDVDREREFSSIDESIIAGRFFKDRCEEAVIVGKEIVKRYRSQEAYSYIDIDAGDRILLAFPDGKRITAKVVGIYSSNLIGNDMYVYMPLCFAEKAGLNVSRDYAREIVLRLSDERKAREVKELVEGLGIDARVYTWEEKLGILKQFTSSLMIVASITGFTALIISFAIIYIVTYMNVIGRKAQIGILEAIGIKRGVVVMMYFLRALIISTAGIATGTLLLLLVTLHIHSHPIKMPIGDVTPFYTPTDILHASIVLLLTSILASSLAVNSVVRIPIVDRIRGD